MPFHLQDDIPPNPVAIGGTCWLCNAAQRTLTDSDGNQRLERYINPLKDIDFEGGVFFCESCVVEMGRLVGMADLEVVGEANHFAIAAIAERTKAEAERDQLAAALRELRRIDEVLAVSTPVDPPAEPVSAKIPETSEAKATPTAPATEAPQKPAKTRAKAAKSG